MLSALQNLLKDRGYLSGLLIDEVEALPSSSAYQSRFGSLLRAYALVGFTPDRDYQYIEINRSLRRLHPTVISETINQIERSGGQVEKDPKSDILEINREFTASIVIARCLKTIAGSLRWNIHFDTGLWPDITVVARMDEDNRDICDYYLLPRIDMTEESIRLAQDNGVSLDSYRFETLEYFILLASRASLQEVA